MSPVDNNNQVKFRADETMLFRLEERVGTPFASSVHLAAQRDLERYYDLLLLSLPVFSYGEAGLLVDVFNGTLFASHSVFLLWASISDALEEGGYEKKWQEVDPTFDGQALLQKLRGLGYFECMAVADAIERFWNGPYHQEGPLEERLRSVGLIGDKKQRRGRQEEKG